MTTEERFWAKVSLAGPDQCWTWTGSVSNHHGDFWNEGKNCRAHRWIYEQQHGPIPASLTLDHLCRNPLCANPAHLEPVTQRVNVLRGVGPTAENARKTHCVHGHEYTEQNTYHRPDGTRECLICKKERNRRWRVKRAARAMGGTNG